MATKKKSSASDPCVSYNEFKNYEGRRYTGMKIGRSHKWYYDQGAWKEIKITPDLWQVSYAVTKRRAALTCSPGDRNMVEPASGPCHWRQVSGRTWHS